MTIQEEYENLGWHFTDIGENKVVGWKNATLKDGRVGCVTVSSDSITIRGRSCTGEQEFAEVMGEEKYIEQVYYVDSEDNSSELTAQFLYDALEAHSADEVGEDLEGIWRYRLVT